MRKCILAHTSRQACPNFGCNEYCAHVILLLRADCFCSEFQLLLDHVKHCVLYPSHLKKVWNAGAVSGIHGIGGTMHVENPRYHNELHDVFFEAAKQYGLKHNPDFNDWGTPQVGTGS